MAASTRHAAATQFLHRLQSYQMFQPLFSASPTSESVAEPSTAITSRADRNSVYHSQNSGRSLSIAPQLWHQIDTVLDASVGYILKHNAEDHFIVTVQSQQWTGELARLPSRTQAVVDSSDDRTGRRGSMVREGRNMLTTAVDHRVPRSVFAQRWAADHAGSTLEATRQGRRVVMKLEQEQEHSSRSFYLRALKNQLDGLEKEQQRRGSEYFGLREEGGADEARMAQEALGFAEEEKQHLIWEAFLDSEAYKGQRRDDVQTGAEKSRRIVSDYLDDNDICEWLNVRWPHHTHRHEGAALRIQCAYRSYRARSCVRHLRYARRQAFITSLAIEAEAQRVWELAMQAQVSTSENAESSDTRIKAINFFIDKMDAVIVKRRARKLLAAQQNYEIQYYAAVSIQRVFRGHRSRIFVNELRHPEIAAARIAALVARSAAIIQSHWRGYFTRVQMCRKRRAACVIQRSYRCACARSALQLFQQKYLMAHAADLKRYAVGAIELWYIKWRHIRYGSCAAHVGECILLQRVGRGYAGRRRARRLTDLKKTTAAVSFIVSCWRRLLARRAAAEALEALKQQRRDTNRKLIEIDAASTIQRAWRRAQRR